MLLGTQSWTVKTIIRHLYVPQSHHQFSSVQSLSCVLFFATPWTAARQASLSITNSRSPPKLMSIESVMPSSHLILRRPLLLLPSIFPSIRGFSNESALHIRWPNIGLSASTSVLTMNTQGWSPLGWTGWISLQSKGLSPQFKSINSSVLSFLYSPALTSIHVRLVYFTHYNVLKVHPYCSICQDCSPF